MTYREQVEKAIATFSSWPKDQQDTYMRMLNALREKLEAIQKQRDNG